MLKSTIVTAAALLALSTTFSQEGDPKKANQYLSLGNFEAALDEYVLLAEDEPENMKYNYRTGVCYLNINGDKSKAVPFLENAVNSDDVENNAYYLLGRAYHYVHKFDKAIEIYKKFKEAGGGTAASTVEVDNQIQYCYNAKELVKFPVNVTFENLGKNVNSVFADYFPFVPVNESFLVFNSKRDEYSEEMPNGLFAANVYMSKVDDGQFTKAIPLGQNINTVDGIEEVIGLSANGDIMLLLFDNKKASGDMFITHKAGESFDEPVKLEETINSGGQEIAASISKDGSTLYFASSRKDGFGGTDIYISKKLPIGGWGPPQNLGPEINTPFDEDFPNISPDGSSLYFSSKGHTSMGGYDIFKAMWSTKKKKFVNVRNIGYPLNTSHDDMNFRVSGTGRYGYIAAIRPEGLGGFDIYRVTFNVVEPQYTIIKGTIRSSDPNKQIEDVIIDITDKKTGDLYGSYLPNFNTMRYVIILPPGEYELFVEPLEHKTIIEDINILDKSSFEAEIEKDIIVTPTN